MVPRQLQRNEELFELAADLLNNENPGTEVNTNVDLYSDENLRTLGTMDLEGNPDADVLQLEMREGLAAPLRHPVMVIPFLAGVSDRLRKAAAYYGVATWFKYPGRSMDMFTRFRGRVHPSKSQDVVYCTCCSCGLQYIGGSGWNLKVRLSEHIQNSSKSALTTHFLNEAMNENSVNHRPTMQNTFILARESNLKKRKMLESICIDHKRARLANTGVSIEMPGIWNLCAEEIAKQLSNMD